MFPKPILATALALSLGLSASAQGGADYGSGIRLNLDKEGSKYIRFITWSQIWLRHVENNPGTMVNGEAAPATDDIGARRIRMLALVQISPRYLILAHWGINNQTFVNGGGSGATGTGGYGQGKKPQLFFHDVWNEYAIVPAKDPVSGKANKFTNYLGAGIHYWNGISRMTSASTLNFLTIDAPIFNWPLIENSDQFGRQFGLYTKGVAGKLHYQLNLNKPFATNVTPQDSANRAVDNNGNAKFATGGYFDYQFFDQEANVLPYRVGTYVGTKKVFNVGAGWYHHKDGVRYALGKGDRQKHDISIFATDVFADMPIGNPKKKMAVTAYSVWYHHDFGPNYWRASGTMNLGSDDPSVPSSAKAVEGAGDARVLLGTGDTWYTQAGLLLPASISKKVRFQPFAAYTWRKLEAFPQQFSSYDAGMNAFLDGHHAKITLQYSARPLHDANKILMKSRSEWMLQFQVYL